MEPPTPQKKGLGPLAWLGIGCGGLIVLAVIGLIVGGMMFGGKAKQFLDDAQKNPTRATASVMVTTGQFEMTAEDDANKRYTVKQKKTGQLITIYWSEREKAPKTIDGDFSAIPPEPAAPVTPTTPAPK